MTDSHGTRAVVGPPRTDGKLFFAFQRSDLCLSGSRAVDRVVDVIARNRLPKTLDADGPLGEFRCMSASCVHAQRIVRQHTVGHACERKASFFEYLPHGKECYHHGKCQVCASETSSAANHPPCGKTHFKGRCDALLPACAVMRSSKWYR